VTIFSNEEAGTVRLENCQQGRKYKRKIEKETKKRKWNKKERGRKEEQ
jgi:hypothetical protein